MSQFDFDLLIIGAGSGGVRASRLASQAGKRVAVAEESRVGGTCVMRGCVPKKLLVYGAEFANHLEDMAGYGWDVEVKGFDWPRLISAKNSELNRLEGIYGGILRNNNVTLLEGRGVVVDAHTVDVGGKHYTAETILIAVGGWPDMPAIPGAEFAISSNEALDLMTLPKRMVIVGAGYIAVEFAGIFHAMGVEVTQVLRRDLVLRGFDQDIREHLHGEMAKHINFKTNANVTAIAKTDAGYNVTLDTGETLETDLVMYATGRKPKTKGLGLEEAGVKLREDGAVLVDEYSKTNIDSIYAIGDATDRMNLTPVALNEAICLIKTLYGGQPMSMDYENIASAVFSMPPIGTVGLTEEQAAKLGPLDVYVSRFRPMRNILAGRDERTIMKIVVDQATDKVLGIHMCGPDAGEIIQGFAVAMKLGVTKKQLDSTVGIHPTAAEELVTLRDKRK